MASAMVQPVLVHAAHRAVLVAFVADVVGRRVGGRVLGVVSVV
jgi:hypothetical protein